MANEPHLKPRYAFMGAPRCGAKTKKTGLPCQAPAMPNGRCRMHGGKSTGPKTPEGLERSRAANLKHGYYSKAAIEARRTANELISESMDLIQTCFDEKEG
ncbi:MAG: HGGxSTG domain-containing protein [Desulfoferrobacter sp.]